MANREHVEIVKQGANAIAEWRKNEFNTRLDLTDADLHGTDLRMAGLGEADLRRANLNWANLTKADLHGADLHEADLIQAHLNQANLRGAKLIKACLAEAILIGVHLEEGSLAGASLIQANLSGGDLTGANLSEAILDGVAFVGTRLGEANLCGANLTGANLREAVLTGADFREAHFGRTGLSFLDFSATRGLETARHDGPSDIGIQTIVNSNGKIPDVFLRGCGVPEAWITHIPSILGAMQPIQFYSCFISYSHADKSFAQRLYEALQARGIRCWLDEHQLLPGDDPHEQIDRGIRLWDKVLLCASKDSLASWWVDNEIATAFEKERQLMKDRGKKVLALIPLDLDGYLFSKDCPNAKQTQLKTRIAAKFAGWDKDNALFEREFDRLIKALQTNDTGRETPPTPKL